MMKDEVIGGVAECLESVLVVRATGSDVHMETGRDHWYHEVSETVADECAPEDGAKTFFRGVAVY